MPSFSTRGAGAQTALCRFSIWVSAGLYRAAFPYNYVYHGCARHGPGRHKDDPPQANSAIVDRHDWHRCRAGDP